jgi:hypothetical protein
LLNYGHSIPRSRIAQYLREQKEVVGVADHRNSEREAVCGGVEVPMAYTPEED